METLSSTLCYRDSPAPWRMPSCAAELLVARYDKKLEKQERKRLQVEHANKKSQRAKILKLADKTSNLRAIAASPPPEWSVKRRLEYVDWARKVSRGLVGVSKWLEGEFEQAAKEAERLTVFHR